MEVGLSPKDVEMLGRVAPTAFRMTPFIPKCEEGVGAQDKTVPTSQATPIPLGQSGEELHDFS